MRIGIKNSLKGWTYKLRLYRKALTQLLKKLIKPYDIWLKENAKERMDATRVDLFNRKRALFHLDRYLFASDFTEGKIVADIACGTGYGTKCLVGKGGAKRVFGIDIDSDTIKYANKFHADPKIRYICTPATQTGLPSASIDIITSFETIEHLQEEVELLEEFYRLLRESGELILSTPNDWGLEIAPFHVRNYNLKALKEKVSEFFKIERIYNQNSGCMERKQNSDQPRGIVPTNDDNFGLAECYIVIAQK